jgi:GT2 family glycosyltransferase
LTDPSEPEIVRNLPATNPAGSAADVGYTLINYNTAAQTLRCVESLAACTPPPAWILVLDNASASADFEHLAANLTAAPASHIQLHRSPQNLGFAAGSNFLVQHLLNTAGCHFIGLLNNDAVAMPGLVAQLKDALTAQPAQPTGMAGGRMHSLHRPHQVDTLGISLYASLMPADRKSAADPYLGPTGGCCLMTRAFVHDIIATTGYFLTHVTFATAKTPTSPCAPTCWVTGLPTRTSSLQCTRARPAATLPRATSSPTTACATPSGCTSS